MEYIDKHIAEHFTEKDMQRLSCEINCICHMDYSMKDSLRPASFKSFSPDKDTLYGKLKEYE